MRQVDIWSFIVCTVIFGAVIYASQPIPLLNTRQKEIRQLAPRKWLLHHVWQALVAIATIFGLVGGIEYFFGRPWPTDPEIHPLEFVSGTPLSHLFKVQNRSAFDLNDVEMTCGVDLFATEDVNGQLVGGTDIAFVTPAPFCKTSACWST